MAAADNRGAADDVLSEIDGAALALERAGELGEFGFQICGLEKRF